MKLNLNNPCFESWNEMSDTNGGKFCDVCSKKVFDLCDKTNEEVAEVFKTTETNSICIKIQANRVSSHFSFAKSFAGIVLATSLTSAFHAQTPEKDTINALEIEEVFVMGITQARFDDDGNKFQKTVYKSINGWIKSEENRIESNAEVHLLNLQNLYKIKTNNQGYFSFNIPEKELKYETLLAIKLKKASTKIYLHKFNRNNSENQHINFLEKDGIALNSKEINKAENFFFNGEKITYREFTNIIENEDVEYFYLPNSFAQLIFDDKQKGLYVAYSKNN